MYSESAWLTGSLGGKERGGLTLTLIPLGVDLVELLGELSQGLLNGLWAGHGQGKPSLKVLHLVHGQQGAVVGPGRKERTRRCGRSIPMGARL